MECEAHATFWFLLSWVLALRQDARCAPACLISPILHPFIYTPIALLETLEEVYMRTELTLFSSKCLIILVGT
jgi:hypothetical protein